MSEINKFAEPDTAAAYLIALLDFYDAIPELIEFRREANQRMTLAEGDKFLELGCGGGGSTIPMAAFTGPTGLVAGVDISTSLLEIARHEPLESRAPSSGKARRVRFPIRMASSMPPAPSASSFICPTAWGQFAK